MLQAKTTEQRNHVEEIANEYLRSSYREYCDYLYGCVYYNGDNEESKIEINLKCDDCGNELCIDIPFDMMAAIVDYLREQNCAHP